MITFTQNSRLPGLPEQTVRFLAQALRRFERLERCDGLEVCRVMEAPHGALAKAFWRDCAASTLKASWPRSICWCATTRTSGGRPRWGWRRLIFWPRLVFPAFHGSS